MDRTNLGLVEYCEKQLGRPYWWGTFGQIANQSLYDQKKRQYPSQYTASDFKSQFGQKVHDCVGLIKGFLWTDEQGLVRYTPSQDKDVSGMKANCEAGNIKDIPEIPGLLVFMKGHVGVYIGNGEVIEARGHKFGVVKTKLKERAWTEYGKLKWIEYKENNMFEDGQEKEALKYLAEKGRVTNIYFWEDSLKYYKNINYLIIKWANDVKKLENVKMA